MVLNSNISNNNITSNNGEKLYYSLDSLSFRISDYGYTYLLPTICAFGIITNAITIIILVKGRLKGIMYKYMLFMCIFEIIEMAINFWLMLVRCGTLCPYGYEYLSKVYEQYLYLYLHNVSIFYSNIADLHIAFNRLNHFSKNLKSFSKKIPFKLRTGFFLILGFAINYPNYILSRDIVKIGSLVTYTNGNTTSLKALYQIKNNAYNNNVYWKVVLFILAVSRKLLLLIILFIANVIMGFMFKKYIKNKELLGAATRKVSEAHSGETQNEKLVSREKNIMLMVLVMCVKSLVGQLLYSIGPILFTADLEASIYNLCVLVGIFLNIFSSGLNIFIYLIFNKSFRYAFFKLLNLKCISQCRDDTTVPSKTKT